MGIIEQRHWTKYKIYGMGNHPNNYVKKPEYEYMGIFILGIPVYVIRKDVGG